MSKQTKKEMYEGKEIQTNVDGMIKVIEYKDSRNVIVEFINTGYRKTVASVQLRTGEIKDNSLSSLFNVQLTSSPNAWKDNRKIYHLWIAIHERCYGEKRHKTQPAYKDCETSDNFKNFDYFKDWCSNQTGYEQALVSGWQLDKDILVKGNKIYSENTCCFVPQEINTLILSNNNTRGLLPIGVTKSSSGKKFRARLSKNGELCSLGTYNTPQEAFYAYKQIKEEYIKELATFYRDDIDTRTYTALMNWNIAIND